MGPDMIDSTLLTEAPTLKLLHHTLPDRLDMEKRIDGCQVTMSSNIITKINEVQSSTIR